MRLYLSITIFILWSTLIPYNIWCFIPLRTAQSQCIVLCIYVSISIYTLLYLIRETTPPVHDKHHSCSRYKMRRAAPAAYLLMQTEKSHHVKVKSPHCVFGDTSWECNEANICKIFFTFSVKRIFSTVQEVFYWLCSASLVFCLSHHSWQLSSLISPSLSFQSNFEISGL